MKNKLDEIFLTTIYANVICTEHCSVGPTNFIETTTATTTRMKKFLRMKKKDF